VFERIFAGLTSLVAMYRNRRGAIAVTGVLVAAAAPFLFGVDFPTALALAALVVISALAMTMVTAADAVGVRRRLRRLEAATRPTYVATLPQPSSVGPAFDPTSPTVTVVVTARNEAAHIRDCLMSVQRQTWGDWECIVVDDASTDATLDVAVEMAADARFVVVHLEDNAGLAAARNEGLARARGRYATFLDADDHLHVRALEARLLPLSSDRAESGWVAGSFCGWHWITEDAHYAAEGPDLPVRGLVGWLDAVTEAPFIASAPLVRTDIALTVGGFDPTVRTAEDYDFWCRILRRGHVFEPVQYTGVAYRQKRSSMIRSGPDAHATVTSNVITRNWSPAPPGAHAGPHPFTDSPGIYMRALALARRRTIAMVGRLALDGDTPHGDLRQVGVPEPWMRWAFDFETLVEQTARRIEYHTVAGREERVVALTERALEVMGPRPAAPEPKATPVHLPSQGRRLRSNRWSGLAEANIRPGTVLVMPSAWYHCDEAGPIADVLASKGVPVSFGVLDFWREKIRPTLMKYGHPVVEVADTPEWAEDLIASGVGAILTFNDWGDHRELVLAANRAGIPTFGKVEGVQDWDDVDTGVARNAYGTVAHVLCQGGNDVAATTGDRIVVGSTRLERIWMEPPTSPREELAVINMNFTYDVFDEAADEWLAGAIEACRRVDVPFAVSAHPATPTSRIPGGASRSPIRHLLTLGTVLVSRFSTVPFEALARGVPFVYHNPHGEKVPTFQRPDGAFPVTATTDELVEALGWCRSVRSGYRDLAEGFFRRQVDIDPERRAEERAAAALTAQTQG
jgi:hypothetical protein